MAPPPRSYLHTRCLSRLQSHHLPTIIRTPIYLSFPGHAAGPAPSYLHTRCLSRLQLHPPLEVRRPGHAALQQAGGQAVLSGEAAHDDGAQLLGVTCEEVRCNIMPGLVRHMFQLEGQHQVALWRSD